MVKKKKRVAGHFPPRRGLKRTPLRELEARVKRAIKVLYPALKDYERRVNFNAVAALVIAEWAKLEHTAQVKRKQFFTAVRVRQRSPFGARKKAGKK